MNLHTTGLIIRREYLNKVKKKSFLITTFVVPILMAALCVVPILLMATSKDKAKRIAVVDQSGIVMSFLDSTETIVYEDFGTFAADTLKKHMRDMGFDAVLSISPLDVKEKSVIADLTSIKPLGMTTAESINHRVDKALEAYRIDSYEIPGLEQIIKDVKGGVKFNTYTMDEEGKETISESGVISIMSMIFGLLIFLFITLFGGMVMTAVIEEKSSRVVEVLISSVKATELMFGKIIGVALVALTQFVLWIVLTAALVAGATAFLPKDMVGQLTGTAAASQMADPEALAQMAGVDASQIAGIDALSLVAASDSTAVAGEEMGEVAVVLQTLQNAPIAKFVILFLIFFILGYMLYASLYAAIGSAVESEGDSQQLQMPVTIPLMIAYFIALYTFNAPDSAIAFWGSMIPFTSPIVMLARLPFGVPDWQLAVSLVLLVATFCVCAWLSAKIYKVGILMFGKKSTFKDLWKWLKLK
ncbi:MAG: ABC transporter permease [Bacteroidales bacterium]|nr:ABC transporter permease [Candidatus Cryptobacteroides aphodequi]